MEIISVKKLILINCLLTLAMITNAQQCDFTKLSGPYLGQKPPGDIPIIFAPGIVSKPEFFEHSSVYFTPNLNEIYWLSDSASARNRKLLYTNYNNGKWSSPIEVKICEHYSNSNICFSADGKRIYFTSRRPLNIDYNRDFWSQLKDSDIWYADKIDGSWSKPINFNEINTSDDNILGIILSNGKIYYSNYNDIYEIEMNQGKYHNARKLEFPINTESADNSPYMPDDESYILFESMRDGGYGGADLYISFKGQNGRWTEPINLGDKINTQGHERSPYLSPDGKYLFFWRVTNGSDIYWVSTKIIEELKPTELK